MNSPPHRANILSPRYGSIGIGAVWSGHALYVTQDFANVLDELSVDDLETAIQRQLGKPPEVRPHDARLRQIACSMAEHKRLNPDELLRAFPKARNAFAFTISDPERLPAGLQAMRTAPRSGYALGACFVRDDSTPEGVFWVAAVFF